MNSRLPPALAALLCTPAGTSVQANHAAEPTNGAVSGPELARLLQEAYAGYQLTSTLWVDGGIFHSNVGMESWVSRDNPTYTRSLVADFPPYYAAGVRAVWQAMPKLAVRLDVVNGWQNISETNTDKAAGLRLDYALTPAAILSYYNFVGNEAGSRLRVFNGVGVNGAFTDRVRVMAQLDYGTQQRDGGDGTSTWYGFTAGGRVQMSPAVALAGRVERFDDDDQVLIATGAALPGFRANSASLGLDVAPHHKVLWRTEVRGYQGEDAIFPDRDEPSGVAKSSAVFVTSLALTY
ncbi:MAG TPA: outer membrane beta-barrel protein [Gemmatimonadaceae bacterium]|nr:outer membrane beta-barrel protein [Gemmatimonadaceae bacterium]